MNKYDCLYIGRGSKEITFASDDETKPAKFYFNSVPAHKTYPTTHAPMSKANPKKLEVLKLVMKELFINISIQM